MKIKKKEFNTETIFLLTTQKKHDKQQESKLSTKTETTITNK